MCAAAAPFWAPLFAPVPAASAEPCPDVEVVFARGTDEPPGVGDIGENFVDTLRSHVGPKSLGVYPVDYPATTDFPKALDGIVDAGTHVESMAASCPKTQMVLGGYSQGAAVVGFVTVNAVPDGAHLIETLQPMPPEVADHVAAVALFGKPSSQFMSFIHEPPITIGPLYEPKTIDLCVPNDAVCSGQGDFTAHKQYVEAGMVDQAVDFAAGRLETPPANPTSATPTPSPAPGPAQAHGPGSAPGPAASPSPAPAHSPAPVASPSPTPTPSPAPVVSHSPGPPPGPVA
jgi:cutinase